MRQMRRPSDFASFRGDTRGCGDRLPGFASLRGTPEDAGIVSGGFNSGGGYGTGAGEGIAEGERCTHVRGIAEGEGISEGVGGFTAY